MGSSPHVPDWHVIQPNKKSGKRFKVGRWVGLLVAFYLGGALDHLSGLHSAQSRAFQGPTAEAAATAAAGGGLRAAGGAGAGCRLERLPPGSLQVDMEGDVLPPKCLHLRDVCADQQEVVLMGPRYRPDAAAPRPLPQFAPVAKYNFPWRSEYNPDPLAVDELLLPPLTVRAASSREPTADLEAPVFSDAVVPLLLFPMWQENFGHTFGQSIGWLYTHLKKNNGSSWVGRAQLVLRTPHGLAVPRHWHALVAPLSPRPVQSFAEFSERPPGGGSSSSDESCRSRCFRNMLVCAADGDDDASNPLQAARFIADFYSARLPPPPVKFPPPRTPGEPVAQGAQQQRTVLRVLFAARQGATLRATTNLEELLKRCREWTFTLPTTKRAFAASCQSWQFGGDLLANIAAVRSADVLIGIHGASMVNGFFMEPGSSMVEVFPSAWAWHIHKKWIDRDPQAHIQWWALVVKDPAAFTPGSLELQMGSQPGLYQGPKGPFKRQRDRNMRIPWAGLDRILREIAGSWRNPDGYRDAELAHRQAYEATADGVRAIPMPINPELLPE